MFQDKWRDLLSVREAGLSLVRQEDVDDVALLMAEARIDPQKFLQNVTALIRSGPPRLAVLDVDSKHGQIAPIRQAIERSQGILQCWFIE